MGRMTTPAVVLVQIDHGPPMGLSPGLAGCRVVREA